MSSATGRDTDLLGYYANEGIKLVRLNGHNRRPMDDEWQRRTFPLEDVVKHVRRGGGVGWQCGEASGWISVADTDWREARRLAPKFFPDTLRSAKGREEPSHYIYRSVGLGYKTFKGQDGTTTPGWHARRCRPCGPPSSPHKGGGWRRPPRPGARPGRLHAPQRGG